MKTGNIILVHNPMQWGYPVSSLFWALLRVFTGYYHHCAMFWDADGVPMIVEAVGTGVTVTHFSVWEKRARRNIKVIPAICPAEGFLIHAGKKYDRSSLFLYCLVKKIKGIWLGPDYAHGTDKLYCFELAAYAHGLPNANQILPNELINAFPR